MVCGLGDSLNLRFTPHIDGVSTELQMDERYQGYSEILHGGMISTLLDAAMTHCLFHHGIEALTADMQIRFLKPVPCNTQFLLSARLIKCCRSVYYLDSTLCCAGEMFAKASARFFKREVP